MPLPWFCNSRWHHKVQMPSWILSGWQRDSDVSPWRTPADGFTPTPLSRWALVTAVTRRESVFWCEIRKCVIAVCPQCNAPRTRCAMTHRVSSWAPVGRRATRTCRCAPGASPWRKDTMWPLPLKASTRRESLTCWRFSMVKLKKNGVHVSTLLIYLGLIRCIRWCQTSSELFPISLRSDSQQPHSGNPKRWPSHAL